MDQEQLYVLDVYPNKITFAPCVKDIPCKDEIDITVSFKNFVNMNIKSEDSVATPADKATGTICRSKDELALNFGKSQVFFSNTENLITALKESPLNLLLSTQCNSQPLGEVSLSWTSDFVSMVDRSNSEKVMPAGIESIQDILSNETGQLVGQIDIFVRLSCFGLMTFEQFQELPKHPLAVQPPQLMKNLFQPPEVIPTITFLIGLISFTIFISALYLAVK